MLQKVQTTLKRWIGGEALTATERDLLDTIRESAIPNPDVLREQWARLSDQIATTEAEWERLDKRADPSAFLAATRVAERLQALRAEAGGFPQQIEAAGRQRTAFLAANRQFESVAATVAAQTEALLFRPPQDTGERNRQLRALNDHSRLHIRLAGELRAVSSSPTFREPADALAVLRDTYTAQIRQCDLLRTPGSKPRFVWPEAITSLLDIIANREPRRKETA